MRNGGETLPREHGPADLAPGLTGPTEIVGVHEDTRRMHSLTSTLDGVGEVDKRVARVSEPSQARSPRVLSFGEAMRRR